MFARSSIVFELQHYRLHSQKVEALLEQEMQTLKSGHEEVIKDWPDFNLQSSIGN
jgi:hypothetical protein